LVLKILLGFNRAKLGILVIRAVSGGLGAESREFRARGEEQRTKDRGLWAEGFG
jgi:hypothetical protein